MQNTPRPRTRRTRERGAGHVMCRCLEWHKLRTCHCSGHEAKYTPKPNTRNCDFCTERTVRCSAMPGLTVPDGVWRWESELTAVHPVGFGVWSVGFWVQLGLRLGSRAESLSSPSIVLRVQGCCPLASTGRPRIPPSP
eukprot:1812944-Rhodomonas_salina.1